MNENKNNNRKEEQCILCRRNTGVDFSTDISEREYYVIGCGQLCADCYKSIYSY